MNFFYEITLDTEVHNTITELLEMKKRWNNNENISKKMVELLGLESTDQLEKNVACWPGRLMMAKPPEHLKNQFCKNQNSSGFYEAKKTSLINREWVGFCKDNNLTNYDIWDYLNWNVGLYGTGKRKFQKIKGRYFIKSEHEFDLSKFTSLKPHPRA